VQWDSLRALFEAALERPPADRAAFVRAHTDDEDVGREVESLLAAHEQAGGFLIEPALGPARGDRPLGNGPRFAAGQRLGAFEIVGVAGSGGMGEVYRARDTRLDRFVAIKVLSPAIHSAHGGRERFEREARAVSRLSHPHICTIYDVGAAQVDGQEIPFLVLELLEGETLATRLTRGPLSLADAVTYAVDIADALASAHAKGIVHRDLKPSNVMLTASGIKLLDFGLARLQAPEAASDGGLTIPEDLLTSAGRVLGTGPYMSPEQVEGGTIDARSDIFSFGSLLYELLTGRRAFPGDSGRPPISQILRDDPTPVSTLIPAIPEDLASIVARCLRKDRTRRYQNMADVKVALEDVAEALRSGPRTQASPPIRRWRLAWMVVLACAVIAFGYLAWRGEAPSDVSPPREMPLTTLQGYEASPTLAPDGEHVAFSWGGPNHDNVDIYIQRIGSGTEVRRTVDSARDFSPAWSPDGQWIAFLRGEVPGRSELMLIPPLGGAEQRLAGVYIPNAIVPNYLSWLPDSGALVVVNAESPQSTEGLFAISLKTRELRALTRPTSPFYHYNPAVSPDGRSVVFRSGSAISLVGLTADLRAAAEPRLLLDAPGSQNPTWTPDGAEIVYSQMLRLWRIEVTGERAPRPLPFGGEGAIMPAISRPAPGKPSRLVYVLRSADQNLWRIDLPALGTPSRSAPVLFPSSTRTDYNAQFSPDGKRLAFQSDRSGQMEIWVSDADGANARPLTAMGASNTGTPRWSPDGRMIAFDSTADGSYEIYVVSADGGKPKRLTFEPAEDHVPSFSRDGRFLYFSSRRSGEFEIWKTPASGGEAVRVTRNGGFVAFESFDRRHVYYTQTSGGTSALWRIPTSGGDPERVLDGVSDRAFELLQGGIYYIERLGGGAQDWGYFRRGNDPPGTDDRAQLRFFDFASSKSSVLAELGQHVRIGLAASPDGRTIIFSRLDNPTSDLMMVENFR
jgi:serine/threonine protein kinase/WD40 repeat protein